MRAATTTTRSKAIGAVCCALALGSAFNLCRAQEPEVSFRLDVVGAEPGAPAGEITPWTIEVPSLAPSCVDIELELVLVTALEPCASDPSACMGGEVDDELAFCGATSVCNDQADNDEDGLIDLDDPDCAGVVEWSIALQSDSSFHLSEVTTEGTVADLITRPPGRRDGCSFTKSEVVMPGFNAGQEGAVSVITLSITNPGYRLEPVGEHVVLKLHGSIATSEFLEDGRTVPSVLRVVESGGPSLVGSGGPVRTYVKLTSGELIASRAAGAAITLERMGETPFLRGDANADGTEELTDAVFVFEYLFLGGESPPCLDAADANDSGNVDLTDGIAILSYLFLDSGAPAPPGPSVCGIDPTTDDLPCAAFSGCPPAGESSLCVAPPPSNQTPFCMRRDLPSVARAAVVADLDGDNAPDLVSGGSDAISVHRGRGDTTFLPPESLFFNDSRFSRSPIAVDDLNGDDLPDIVVGGGNTSRGDPAIVVFVNAGDALFDPREGFFWDSARSQVSVSAMSLGEFNGDDAPDLAVTTSTFDDIDGANGTFVRVLLGLGDGSFLESQSLFLPTTGNATMVTADLDRNGASDVVVAQHAGILDPDAGVWVILNSLQGTFEDPVRHPAGLAPRAPSIGDLNGDSVPDLVVANLLFDENREGSQLDAFSVFLGVGDGTFEERQDRLVAPALAAFSTCGECRRQGYSELRDVDGDGNVDFVFERIFGSLSILPGRGDGRFGEVAGTSAGGVGGLTLADLDGDGDLDLVTAGFSSGFLFTNCTVP